MARSPSSTTTMTCDQTGGCTTAERFDTFVKLHNRPHGSRRGSDEFSTRFENIRRHLKQAAMRTHTTRSNTGANQEIHGITTYANWHLEELAAPPGHRLTETIKIVQEPNNSSRRVTSFADVAAPTNTPIVPLLHKAVIATGNSPLVRKFPMRAATLVPQ